MRQGRASPPSTYDVVIVGGGLSGILVAQRLLRSGARVLVLEGGGRPTHRLPAGWRAFDRAAARLVETDSERWSYRCTGRPYEWLRVRALGGRSLLWGGWCSRPILQNWRDAEAVGAPWPVSLRELSPYLRRVERWLHVRSANLTERAPHVRKRLGLDVEHKRCAVRADGRRPTTALDRLGEVAVRANAVALRVVIESGAVRGVSFATDTEIYELRARAVILCASPIETARILEASGVSGPMGEGWSDHVVASCIALQDSPMPFEDATPLAPAAFIPRFVNVEGRGARDYVGGFTTEIVGPRSARHLPRDVRTALSLGLSEARDASFYLVHAMGELMPDPRRRVTFDQTHLDTFGRPTPVVHYGRSSSDLALMRDLRETAAAIADAVSRPRSRIIPIRDPRSLGGAGHEAGTCAMRARGGVADRWGAVRGVRGAWIADASIMPTALDRHPTLTVLALALRTADRVVDTVARGDA